MKYEFVHTCIRVKNLESSLNFYKEALGLQETKRKDFPENGFTLVYLSDDLRSHELELTYNYDREEPYTIGDGYSHIALVVEDLEGSHKKHSDEGYKVTKLMGLPGTPPRFYFITDPDGYSIEIIRKS
ncbi:MAG: lactoylglutathione lyase [Eubacteriaceae bacterium]|nr:lactoylglutathione lyase [Eubacteriaceae bacterium]